jgi:hypothetical protein
LNVRWEISSADRERIPTTGPLLVLANHPFGIVEGLVLGALLRTIRPDVRILANSLLQNFAAAQDHLITVNLFGNEQACLANRRGLRQSVSWYEAVECWWFFRPEKSLFSSIPRHHRRSSLERIGRAPRRSVESAGTPNICGWVQRVRISTGRVDGPAPAYRFFVPRALQQVRDDDLYPLRKRCIAEAII